MFLKTIYIKSSPSGTTIPKMLIINVLGIFIKIYRDKYGTKQCLVFGTLQVVLVAHLKKMPNSNSPTRFINTASLASIISYTLPLLRINKGNWYVEFYAYDPLLHKQHRKRIKANRIKSVKSRRQYASGLKENEEVLLVPLS